MTLTTSSTDVKLMPDGALYWYGNEIVDFVIPTNPKFNNNSRILGQVTRNTNNVHFYCSSSSANYSEDEFGQFSTSNTVDTNGKLIKSMFRYNSDEIKINSIDAVLCVNNNDTYIKSTSNVGYIISELQVHQATATKDLYALWLE